MRSVLVDALRVHGLEACRRAGLEVVDELVEVLRRDRVEFLVPERGAIPWDRVTFLNLAFWTAGGGELLPSRDVAIDQLAHVAWHWVCRKALGEGVAALLLGEAIASSFDVYLIATALRTGVDVIPEDAVVRMAERTRDAGMPPARFEAMLRRWAKDPARAMESLRALLYDVTRATWRIRDVRKAAATVARFDRHELAPLLHHYELANWILAARAAPRGEGRRAAALDRALRRSRDPMRLARESLLVDR